MKKQQNEMPTLKEVRGYFDIKDGRLTIDYAINGLILYIRRDDKYPFVVNRILDTIREKQNKGAEVLRDAWLNELNLILEGTHVFATKQGRDRLVAETFQISGVLAHINHHLSKGTRMETKHVEDGIDKNNPTPVETPKTEEEIKQEEINARMAKLREAKARKKAEREAIAAAEAQKKAKAKAKAESLTVYNETTGEAEEVSGAQADYLDMLRGVKF